MRIGIVGLPQVGKHTLFRLLTRTGEDQSKGKAEVGVAKVPDPRVDFLIDFYKPRKISYAHIDITVIPGLEPGRSKEFLSSLRDVDALVQVVRAFNAPHVPFSRNEQKPAPAAEAQMIQEEIALADWAFADTRLTRLRKDLKRNPKLAPEVELFEKLTAELENGTPFRKIPLSDEEQEALQGMTFLSDKPCIVAVNTDEDQFASGHYPGQEELSAWAAAEEMPIVEVCGQMELEISELGEEDRRLFLEDLGITETGLERVARAAYRLLGLISFFTVGEDEVKAWTTREGSTAREAAGKIHSDIARGFIRAEVVPYSCFVDFNGFHARANGGPNLEGRDYIVQDGDIVHFRFNV